MPDEINMLLNDHRSTKYIYQCLFENSPHAMFVMNHHGEYVYVNPSFERLMGYTCVELEKESYQTRGIIGSKYIEISLKGESQNFSYSLLDKNECRIETSITLVPIKVGVHVAGLYGTIRNTSRRKMMEDKLRQSEELYQLIADNSQDIISYTTPDGICRFVSPAVRDVLGYEPEEIIGKSFITYNHPDDRGRMHDPSLFTSRVRCKDGQYVWLETLIKGTTNNKGEQVSLCVSRDITKRKEVEQELRKSEKRLAQAQHLTKLGCWEWDIATDKKYWSEEVYHILGVKNYPLDVISHETFFSHVHPDDFPYFEMKMKDAFKGEPYDIQFRIIREDGEVRIVHELAEMEFDCNGRIVRMLGTIQDITESKQTQELLMKSEKLAVLGELAAGVGHEIRNPLTSLKGFLQLLQSKVNGYEKYFTLMLSEISRISSIVSEFMYLAKPQATVCQTVDLNKLIRDLLPLLEAEATMNNVQVASFLDEKIPLLSCEKNQIKQVFINLFKNAIEAMPEGGKVIIEVREKEEHLMITISDEGCGIPEDRLPKLGEPFYSTKEKGTGLGLMVSQRIIENHNGRIEITSQVGKGTTIDVLLPVLQLPLKN